MSSKFLHGTGSTGLEDGSADLNINSITVQSLIANLPVKTNTNNKLVSSLLSQTDVVNLTNDLALKGELGFTNSDTHATPSTGETIIYAKVDKKMYQKDDAGVETALTGGGGGGGSSLGNGSWGFDTSLSGAPATGSLLWNNAVPASMTSISVRKVDFDNDDFTILLSTLRFGDQFIMDDSTGANKKLITLTSNITDNTTYFTWSAVLEDEDNAANYSNGLLLSVELIIQNPFDQQLNTTSNVIFNDVTIATDIEITDDIINTTNSQQYSTGVLTGGNVSITAPGATVFSISAGTGIIVDLSAGTHTTISWAAIVNQNISTLTPNEAIHIFYFDDSSGTVKEQLVSPTPLQRRDRVYVGGLSLDPTFAVVIEATTLARMATCPNNNLSDLAEVIGPINTGGNLVSSASLLTFKKDLGNIFSLGANWAGNVKTPNIVAVPEMDSNGSDTFVIAYQTATPSADIDIHTLSATSIIPAQYDNGSGAGSPGTVNNNEWTVMRVLVTVGGTVILMAGQQIHSSIDDAIAATGQGTVPSTLLSGSVTVAFLIVKGNLNDFNNDNNSRIIQASKFGTGGSGSSISNMQNIYDNSTQPQIETSDAVGAMQYKRGTTGGDTDTVFEVLNGSDVSRMNITGEGVVNIGAQIVVKDFVNSLGSTVQGITFKDSLDATLASVQVASQDLLISSELDGDIILDPITSSKVRPLNDGDIDLGTLSKRFKDIHLSGQVNSRTIEAVNPVVSDLATVFTVKNNAGDSRFTVLGGGSAIMGSDLNLKDYNNLVGSTIQNLVFIDSANATTAGINVFNDKLSITNGNTNGDLELNLNGSAVLKPAATSITDIGTSSLKFKDAHFGGTLNAGGLFVSSTAPSLNLLDTNNTGSTSQHTINFLNSNASVEAKIEHDGSTGDLVITNNSTNRDLVIALDGTGSIKAGNATLTNPAGSDLATVFTVNNMAGSSRFSILGSGSSISGTPMSIKDFANTGNASTSLLLFKDDANTTIASIGTDTGDMVLTSTDGAVKTTTQAYSEMNTLSNAATILTDMKDGNVHQITLTGATSILGAPSNLRSGATYIFIFTQGSASRLLTYNTIFKFPSGSVPALSVVSGAQDVLSCVYNGTSLFCSLTKSFS